MHKSTDAIVYPQVKRCSGSIDSDTDRRAMVWELWPHRSRCYVASLSAMMSAQRGYRGY